MNGYLGKVNKYMVVAVCIVWISIACEQSPENGAKPETVRLYTSVPVKLVQEIKNNFEQQYKHITLEVNRAGTAKIMQRIEKESAEGEVKADVIWLADFSNAEELKKRNLLQQYFPLEDNKLFPLFKDPNGFYCGSRLLNMVLAYNTRYVKTAPKSYKDLLAPEVHNRIGIVNPETSGSSLYAITSLMLDQEYGEQYIEQLSNNGAEIVANNSTLTEKIAGGELSMGITIDYSIRNLIKKNPDLPVNYVYPEEGTIVIASPIALTKDSRAIESSKQFINWVLSVDGQHLLSSKLGMSPVREDVNAPDGMVPLNRLLVFPSEPDLINKNREIALKKYRELFNVIK